MSTSRFLPGLLTLALVMPATLAMAEEAETKATETEEETTVSDLEKRIENLESRVTKTEVKDAKDRLNFTGDARVRWNSIHGETAAYNQMTSAGMLPTASQKFHNWKLYTLRLRLNMDAPVSKNIKFRGRLGMYKVFGDSTEMSIFNGQPNSFYFDGEAARVPYGSSLKVERAYFDWTNIGGTKFYLSLGRRPSTDGAPEHLEQNDVRQGSPMAHTINYAFDGMTVGYKLDDWLPGSVFKFCYGVGYESGFRNGDLLSDDNVFNSVSGDALKDTDFLGINWDVINDGETLIQTQHALALNLTDLSPGLAVFPYAVDPATGLPYSNPTTIQPVQRMTATQDVGDIYMGSLMLLRNELEFDWFVSAALSRTFAKGTYSNYGFGGMLCDQGGTCDDETGWSIWTGLVYPIESINTKVGFEYNYGSKYWVSFTQGADDIVGSKIATRGHVADVFTIFQISKNAFIKLNYQYYKYNFSGSGWHLGLPKKLDNNPNMLFPTAEHVHNIQTAMQVNF